MARHADMFRGHAFKVNLRATVYFFQAAGIGWHTIEHQG